MVSLPQLHDPPPGDGCGPCTACCDVNGIIELGKPYYARCRHLVERGCGIYEHRPQSCHSYRCAWHLGMLGPNTDRRPNECGVIFQFDLHNGRWALSMLEVKPGAGRTERARYLRDIILKSKKVRHLPLANPAVHFFAYGADIPVPYAVSQEYEQALTIDPSLPMKQVGGEMVFSGRCRELLMPKVPAENEPTP